MQRFVVPCTLLFSTTPLLITRQINDALLHALLPILTFPLESLLKEDVKKENVQFGNVQIKRCCPTNIVL